MEITEGKLRKIIREEIVKEGFNPAYDFFGTKALRQILRKNIEAGVKYWMRELDIPLSTRKFNQLVKYRLDMMIEDITGEMRGVFTGLQSEVDEASGW